MSNPTRNFPFRTAVLFAAFAATAALATSVGLSWTPNGINRIQHTVVDFKTAPLGGWRVLPDGSKYLNFSIDGTGGCYEMYTYYPNGTPVVGDTKIWFKKRNDADTKWQILNDNYQAAKDKYSKTRIWIEQYNGNIEQFSLALAANGTANNNMVFGYYVFQIPGLTSGNCGEGKYSLAKYVGGVLQIFRREG